MQKKRLFPAKKRNLILTAAVVIGFLVLIFLFASAQSLEISLFKSGREPEERTSLETNSPEIYGPETDNLTASNLTPAASPSVSVEEGSPTDTQEESSPNANTQKEVQANSESNSYLSLKYNVPFTAQAPFGDWDDPLQQDGCEEASALMAVYWAKGELLPDLETARAIIVAAGEWQQENYPTARDTSTQDTADRIIKEYFDWPYAEVRDLTSLEQILESLQAGSLVITPMNGQKLGNPHYTEGGPERHMLVIIGYDAESQEFITNDPGTRQGRGFRYDQDTFWNAIRDYPTGSHEPIIEENKTMIIVSKAEL